MTCPTARALPDKRKHVGQRGLSANFRAHMYLPAKYERAHSTCSETNAGVVTNVVESFSFTTTRGHSYNRYDYVYLCVISFPAIAIPQPVLSLLEGDLLPQAPRVYPKLLPMVPTWRQHHDRPEPVNGRLRCTTATCGTTALGK